MLSIEKVVKLINIKEIANRVNRHNGLIYAISRRIGKDKVYNFITIKDSKSGIIIDEICTDYISLDQDSGYIYTDKELNHLHCIFVYGIDKCTLNNTAHTVYDISKDDECLYKLKYVNTYNKNLIEEK